jgi:hypothetical protein
MLRVKGRITRGALIVSEPVDLPEGAEVELVVVDEAWPPELDDELERRLAVVEREGGVDASVLVRRLRAAT